MDDVQKIAAIHLIPGLIVGVFSAMFSYGTFGFKNEILASVIGFIVLYFIGNSEYAVAPSIDLPYFVLKTCKKPWKWAII